MNKTRIAVALFCRNTHRSRIRRNSPRLITMLDVLMYRLGSPLKCQAASTPTEVELQVKL
jgi:hypothetical protein